MQNIMSFLPLIFVLVLFYVMVFVPENRRKKKFKAMMDALKVNDEVMTRGGIIGKLITIKDDFVILETGPDRVRIKFTKNAIANVMNKSEDNNIDK